MYILYIYNIILSSPQALHFKILKFFSGHMFRLFDFDVTLPDIPILLDDVMCTGNETSLLQCSHNGFNNHNCRHNEDIVLACVGKRVHIV